MQRIGIVGLGFMGSAHYNIYQGLKGEAKVVAIADVDARKRAGDWSAIGGNIDVGGKTVDLDGITMYADARELIASPEVDIVDITLPTNLHAEYALAALAAGKNVFCEKPVARTSAEAYGMAEAAKKAGKRLFVGQCIRFWPAYARAAAAVKGGEYGALRSARFQRHSTLPVWSWDGWLQDDARSGLAALDLHIHDADFVLHAFGKPRAVMSRGRQRAGVAGFDHIVTFYDYGDDRLVMAEGAWEYAPGYPFAMIFTLHFEKGTLALDQSGKLNFYPAAGGAEEVPVPDGSGYEHEIRHFLNCVETGSASEVITPESAADSVLLVEKEIESALTGRPVAL